MSADGYGVAGPGDERRECTTCHAPIGSAQRYCLTCGARQPGGAVDADDLVGPRTVETGAVLPPSYAAPQPAAASPAAGRRATLGFASVVLLALLVGVLGGRLIEDGDDDQGTSTQVVRVEGLPAAGVATAAPATADASDATTSKSAARKAKAAAAKKKAEAERKKAEVAPKKVTRKKVQQTFDDSSGDENLAPQDDDPNGANFDEIK